jgi:hypothetical protein
MMIILKCKRNERRLQIEKRRDEEQQRNSPKSDCEVAAHKLKNKKQRKGQAESKHQS